MAPFRRPEPSTRWGRFGKEEHSEAAYAEWDRIGRERKTFCVAHLVGFLGDAERMVGASVVTMNQVVRAIEWLRRLGFWQDVDKRWHYPRAE